MACGGLKPYMSSFPFSVLALAPSFKLHYTISKKTPDLPHADYFGYLEV
jgi:hypothetical protein